MSTNMMVKLRNTRVVIESPRTSTVIASAEGAWRSLLERRLLRPCGPRNDEKSADLAMTDGVAPPVWVHVLSAPCGAVDSTCGRCNQSGDRLFYVISSASTPLSAWRSLRQAV